MYRNSNFVQQGLEIHGLEEHGPWSYTVFDWIPKHLRCTVLGQKPWRYTVFDQKPWRCTVFRINACKNSLNGLLCHQNHRYLATISLKTCENWQNVFLILLAESEIFSTFFGPVLTLHQVALENLVWAYGPELTWSLTINFGSRGIQNEKFTNFQISNVVS